MTHFTASSFVMFHTLVKFYLYVNYVNLSSFILGTTYSETIDSGTRYQMIGRIRRLGDFLKNQMSQLMMKYLILSGLLQMKK
jgi:hypothetical protein